MDEEYYVMTSKYPINKIAYKFTNIPNEELLVILNSNEYDFGNKKFNDKLTATNYITSMVRKLTLSKTASFSSINHRDVLEVTIRHDLIKNRWDCYIIYLSDIDGGPEEHTMEHYILDINKYHNITDIELEDITRGHLVIKVNSSDINKLRDLINRDK